MHTFKVKCVDAYGISDSLIAGEVYTAIDYGDENFWHIDGKGSFAYWKRRFVLIPSDVPNDDPKFDIKSELLAEAGKITSGARRSAYGTPEDNFERIARFWQAYFENTGRGDVKITARDVSPLMRLMKEARLCESSEHRDSFVDIIGYALTGAEVNGVK
jgi:hypothetical protein